MRLFEAEDRPLYYKRSATAWRNKCLTLTVEQEGFLTRVVDFMWDVGSCIPDTNEGAIMLRMNVLKFRKLAAELIASGHLERRQGYIVNARAFREIEEWNEARIKRARSAVEREFEKRKRTRATPRDKQDNPDPTPTQPRPNPPSTPGVTQGLGPSMGEVASKKDNKNNETRPEVWKNLHIERERKEKEKESKTPPPHAAGVVSGLDDEGSLPPGVAAAVRLVAILFGSETDPDYDRGYALATEFSSRYDPEDVVEAAEDYIARRRDKADFGPVTERRFAEYVRQAKANRKRREAGVQPVEKPEPKRLRPGPICEGMVLAENGDIVLSNGVKAEWLELFGGNERLLSLTLTGAGSRIKPNAPMDPEGQVRALLAAACKNIVTRRENAIASAEHAAKLRNAEAAGAEKTESRHDWIERIASEAEANMRGASK